MKPVVFYSIADNNNKKYADMMLNSLRKFHPDIPHVLIGQEELDINIDADSIVTGDLNHIIEDTSYEVGGVLNNNLIDPPLGIFNIPPVFYLNAGFLAVRSPRFWSWWAKVNYTPFFDQFQYREQDVLNIIFHYGDLKTKIFDFSDKWHGLISKGQTSKMILR